MEYLTGNERVIKRVRLSIAWRQSPYLFKTCVSIPFATEHFLRPGMQFRLFNLIFKGSTWFTVTLNATVQQTQPDIFEMQTKRPRFWLVNELTKWEDGLLCVLNVACDWPTYDVRTRMRMCSMVYNLRPTWVHPGHRFATHLILTLKERWQKIYQNSNIGKREHVIPIALTCALLPPSPPLLKACRVVQSTTY